MHRILDNSFWNNYFDKTSYAIPAAPAKKLIRRHLVHPLRCFRWIELKMIGYSMSVSYIDVRKYDITGEIINNFPQKLEVLFHDTLI